MGAFRDAVGMPIGLPATRWMLEIGARVMKTETELILKSRSLLQQGHGTKASPLGPDEFQFEAVDSRLLCGIHNRRYGIGCEVLRDQTVA